MTPKDWPPFTVQTRATAKKVGLVLLMLVLFSVLSKIATNLRHQFVLNTSSSVAPGLYQRVNAPIEPGSLVLFRPDPETLAWLTSLTGIEGIDTFLKPVYRRGPFIICRKSGVLTLDKDPLPASSLKPRFIADGECEAYDAQQLFMLSTRISNSFDSRHYGPVSTSQVDGIFEQFVGLSYSSLYVW